MSHESGTPILEDAITFEILPIELDGEIEKVMLPALEPADIEQLNPIIPPTSGIRLKILDKVEDQDLYTCPASKSCLFLRLFKAISTILLGKLGRPANILITSDERPTSDFLVKLAIRIIAQDDHRMQVQQTIAGPVELSTFSHSGMSTPYSSATLALFPDLDGVIMITASHNSAVWNGVKFYYKQPIPIAGDLMKEISVAAIDVGDIPMKPAEGITLEGRNFETEINDYVQKLVQEIIPVEGMVGKPVVLWPYMGEAKEGQDLLRRFGVDVILVGKTMEPPDPTVNFSFEEVKGYLEEHGSSVAVLLDADRDRIVFLIKAGEEYVQLNPNELYTAMHNILCKEFGKKIINVRTVPSDPRCDNTVACTIESGVGYKHLGIIQYLACNQEVDMSQFESALIYGKEGNQRTKLDTPEKLLDFIGNRVSDISDTIMMALWEESGGHTINLVRPKHEDDRFVGLEALTPLIGDKFPAPAIVLLCELIYRGFDVAGAIDTTIAGSRVEIEADDRRKKEIMDALETLIGTQVEIAGETYAISDYRDNAGLLDIICLSREESTLFARPSGTGNSVRIYRFGKRETADELARIADYIKEF
jgi:phosphomannomutase